MIRVALSALVTVAAADLTLGALAPPHVVDEVENGMARYEESDPDTIVLGSSNARTFETVAKHLAEVTDGAQRLVAIPVEYGKFTAYRWVYENRIRPVIDSRDAQGNLQKRRLKRFVIVTGWWDAAEHDSFLINVPARAWLLSHFLEDVYRNGITPYNRNYVQRRFQKHFAWSSLSSYRGFGPIQQGLKALLPTSDPAAARRAYDAKVESWRKTIEDEYPRIGYSVEVAALHDILADLRSRGLETTIVIYPLMPGINTDKARATTIRAFREIVEAAAQQYGARLVDFSVGTLLRDDEFESDFDHVTPAGDRRFAEWALDHDLRFLRTPPLDAGDRRP